MFLQKLSVFIRRDRSRLCSSVCRQEVRHSSSGPVPVRTQPYALSPHIFVKFSFASLFSRFLQSLAKGSVYFPLICLISSFPYLSQLVRALTHP